MRWNNMFGSITKHFKDQVVGRAIHDLATTGEASLDGVGKLKYNFIKNEITVEAEEHMLDEVKRRWQEAHHGVPYEI